jgi:hypothetical protein
MTYALGRGVERYDRPTLKVITQQVAANNYKFSSLVLGIVNSLPFQMQQDVATPPAKKKTDRLAEAKPTGTVATPVNAVAGKAGPAAAGPGGRR